MKNLKPIWAQNIQMRRKELNLGSAEKFAEKIDIPYPTYRDIEGGTSEGSFERREKIARALNWSVGDLYRDHSKPTKDVSFSDAAAFLRAYSSLDPDIQKVILMILYNDDSYIQGVARATISRVLKALSPALKTK